jgi:hypothetical protein
MTWGSTRGVVGWIKRVAAATQPYDSEFVAVLARRWDELPPGVRTRGQTLGRHGVGCEGTHGVFPRCDFACAPCYHSRDANKVRIDGPHTLRQVETQMALLRERRGPRAHAQLIGGEVSLLSPDDHAEALLAMRRYGREPMSFTHGDFDYDYLERLAMDPATGKPRFGRLSFAGHFDTTMVGRKGITRTGDEASLDPHRQRFAEMFVRLRREHGVRAFLAHNMTVTPSNLPQLAGVIRRCGAMGYGMFSFQPAAFVGDPRRWNEAFRDITGDEVWAEIERGAGSRLDYHLFEHGDVRCNRVAYGFYVGDRWYPALDGDDRRDLAVREAFFRYLGPVNFTGTPAWALAGKLVRVTVRHPSLLVIAGGWLRRTVRRAGGVHSLVRNRPRPVSFVMHQFMDAADVAPAWALTKAGQLSDEPRLRATQERLAACHYAMAHPHTGELVPACVQHAILDPAENSALRHLLPLDATSHDAPAAGER